MSTLVERVHCFDQIDRVVANQEKFKLRVGAGSSVYATLRTVDVLNDIWSIGGAASAGVKAAGSATIATTFFGSSSGGLAALFGFGAAASTPVGWVVGAGAAAGGLYYGVTRLFRTYHGSRVEQMPRFLNSPVDVLGAAFLDLVGSLAIKVAAIDGHIHDREREIIAEYFIDEWGFDPAYTKRALDLLEETTKEQRISDMANALAEFSRTSPDCDFAKIRKGLSELLIEISEADGIVDEREEMAIERIVGALNQEVSAYSSVKRTLKAPAKGVRTATGWVSGKIRRT